MRSVSLHDFPWDSVVSCWSMCIVQVKYELYIWPFLFHKDRLGAVACLQLTVKHFKIEDHVIVIGGYVWKSLHWLNVENIYWLMLTGSSPHRDTLFKEDFSLIKVKEKFSDLQAMCEDSSLVLSYQCKDEGEWNVRLCAFEVVMLAVAPKNSRKSILYLYPVFFFYYTKTFQMLH